VHFEGQSPDRGRPVFVDGSGRRGRIVRRISWLVGLLMAAYVSVVVLSLLGSPGLSRLSVPGLGPVLPGPAAPALTTATGRRQPAGRLLSPTRSAAPGLRAPIGSGAPAAPAARIGPPAAGGSPAGVAATSPRPASSVAPTPRPSSTAAATPAPAPTAGPATATPGPRSTKTPPGQSTAQPAPRSSHAKTAQPRPTRSP
jgi:hypothetical protein